MRDLQGVEKCVTCRFLIGNRSCRRHAPIGTNYPHTDGSGWPKISDRWGEWCGDFERIPAPRIMIDAGPAMALAYIENREWAAQDGQVCQLCRGQNPNLDWEGQGQTGHAHTCEIARIIDALGGQVVWDSGSNG